MRKFPTGPIILATLLIFVLLLSNATAFFWKWVVYGKSVC